MHPFFTIVNRIHYTDFQKQNIRANRRRQYFQYKTYNFYNDCINS